MKNLSFFSFIWLSIFVTSSAFSQVDPRFEAGIEKYRAQDYEAAKESFLELFGENPTSSSLLYNLGLTEYKLGEEGRAIAYWRKAQHLNPRLEGVETALNLAIEKLELRELPHTASLYEKVRKKVLNHIGWNTLLLVLLVFMSFSFWSFFRFVQSRRISQEQEVSPPRLQSSTIFLFVGFIIASTLVALKGYEHTLTRATVIEETVAARSGPDESTSTLFELFEGMGVIVRESREDWLQVTYPGGRTGWVPKDSVFHTSGRTKW